MVNYNVWTISEVASSRATEQLGQFLTGVTSAPLRVYYFLCFRVSVLVKRTASWGELQDNSTHSRGPDLRSIDVTKDTTAKAQNHLIYIYIAFISKQNNSSVQDAAMNSETPTICTLHSATTSKQSIRPLRMQAGAYMKYTRLHSQKWILSSGI